jgi:UDP-2,3-diacylglucosamine pyrophosphatase LpxH
MAGELNRHTFIISDVHITEPKSRLNIFVAEERFEELLNQTIPTSANGQKSSLVLLGDFIDFARLEPWPDPDDRRPRRVGATEEESVTKVVRAVEANDRVFDALALFCQRNHLLVVPGNHDVDMFWPGVREVFRKRLSAASENVSFVEGWEFESDGLLLCHGHQFTYDNRFDLTPPFVEHDGVRHLERCWGTFFLESVYNLVHYFAPYVNMVHPTERAVLLALKNLGWERIPRPLAAKFVAFFAKHGWRLAAEKMMGASPGQPSVDEVAAMLSISPPQEVVAEAEKILMAEPTSYDSFSLPSIPRLPAPTGTLGRTDEKDFERYAEAQLSRTSMFAAVFGHTHRTFGPDACANGTIVNTGTWTGAIFLNDTTSYSHEELEVAAKSPVQRLSYAHVDMESRSIERGEVT